MSEAFRPDAELQRQLLTTFAGEARDELGVLSKGLEALEADTDAAIGAGRIDEMMRAAHSLKGGARAIELEPVDRIAHALETLLDGATERREFGAETVDLGYRALDAIEALVDAACGGSAASVNVAALCDELSAAKSPPASGEPTAEDQAASIPDAPTSAENQPKPAQTEPSIAADSTVRVSVAKLTRLVGSMRELERARVGLEHATGEMTAAAEAADLAARQYDSRAGAIRDATEQPLARLRRATRELSDDISQARTAPLSLAFDPLPRAVRDLARELGRDVQLTLSGGNIDVDRAVLEVIRPALVHLIRNAVDHGIEPPAMRAAAGKPEEGTIAVSGEARGSQLVIEVTDDGAGIDGEAVKAKAKELGLIDEQTAASIQYSELIRFVLRPGFSTRDGVSEVSGRGVGLDAVFEGLTAFEGRVEVASRLGIGTTVTLRAPLAIAASECIVAEIDGHPVGLRLSDAVRIISLDDVPEEMATVEIAGTAVALAGPAVVDELVPAGTRPRRFAVALEADSRQIALPVDEVKAIMRLHTMPLPPPLPPTDLVRSAAILPSGEVLLLADARALVATLPPAGRILIAEDSASQREWASRVLSAAGFSVSVTADGRAALRELEQDSYDGLLTDFQMPDLDGIELIRQIREQKLQPRLRIILWSASDDVTLRERASEAGADAFIAKGPGTETDILEVFQRLLSAE